MNELFSQGGKGSTGILTNKQAIARKFGVKQSEVVYFSVGAVLTGYKVIYDKETQKSYTLPKGLDGTTAVSLTNGLLVHSGGNVDLGSLGASRREFDTANGTFATGFTLTAHNEQVLHEGALYHWEGALPKVVNAGTTPETTGGVADGAWVVDFVSAFQQQIKSAVGSAAVGYQLNKSGSVVRTVQAALNESGSVLDFGADPTGFTDSSDAFQAACDVLATVNVPLGIYRIDKSIVLKKNVTIVGEGNSGQINRAMSFINMNGDFPFLTNWQEVGQPNSMLQLHVSKLFVQYNPVGRPTVTAGNSNKIAFYFKSTTPGANGLEFSSFEDIVVLGAWAAWWDRTGTYMTTIKRFEARDCRSGFLKATGTTITLENVYAHGCTSGYQFGAMSTVIMNNCALDECPVSISEGSYGGAGLHITDVRCFTINGMDAEVNKMTTDGGGIASLLHFQNSVGTVSGFVGLHNDLVTSGAGASGTVALFRLSDNSLVKFTGCESEFFRNEQPSYQGSGYAITLLSDATSKANVELSRMKAPLAKAGSSPTLLLLSQGYVTWQDCDISGLTTADATVISTKSGVLQASGFVSAAGTTAVTTDTNTTIYTLTTRGTYLVSAYVDGSGVGYRASNIVIWDGSAPSAYEIGSGAFLKIGASGANVYVTPSGTTTVKWSVVKIQ